MKKIYTSILGFGLLLLNSCSTNNSTENSTTINPPANSLKKITEIAYYTPAGTTQIAEFQYENGILKRLFNAGQSLEFEYNGTKIANSKRYLNSVLQNTTTFTYNADLLQTIQVNANERTIFNYQGTVLANLQYQGIQNSIWTTVQSESFTFNTSNNISQTIKIFNNGGSSSSYKSAYTYDTKNNPFKEMNPYIRLFLNYESIDIISQNNKIQKFDFTTPTSTTSTQTEYFEIVYNAQNYPTSIKKKRFTTNELVSEMTIEYY